MNRGIKSFCENGSIWNEERFRCITHFSVKRFQVLLFILFSPHVHIHIKIDNPTVQRLPCTFSNDCVEGTDECSSEYIPPFHSSSFKFIEVFFQPTLLFHLMEQKRGSVKSPSIVKEKLLSDSFLSTLVLPTNHYLHPLSSSTSHLL